MEFVNSVIDSARELLTTLGVIEKKVDYVQEFISFFLDVFYVTVLLVLITELGYFLWKAVCKRYSNKMSDILKGMENQLERVQGTPNVQPHNEVVVPEASTECTPSELILQCLDDMEQKFKEQCESLRVMKQDRQSISELQAISPISISPKGVQGVPSLLMIEDMDRNSRPEFAGENISSDSKQSEQPCKQPLQNTIIECPIKTVAIESNPTVSRSKSRPKSQIPVLRCRSHKRNSSKSE